jgi:hypothetical protein
MPLMYRNTASDKTNTDFAGRHASALQPNVCIFQQGDSEVGCTGENGDGEGDCAKEAW